jgi:hypothetical protein
MAFPTTHASCTQQWKQVFGNQIPGNARELLNQEQADDGKKSDGKRNHQAHPWHAWRATPSHSF